MITLDAHQSIDRFIQLIIQLVSDILSKLRININYNLLCPLTSKELISNIYKLQYTSYTKNLHKLSIEERG